MEPLYIATEGYLCDPLSVATNGYLCDVEVEIDQLTRPKKKGGSGGRSKTSYKQLYKIPVVYDEEKLDQYRKRKEEDEIILFIKIFAKVCL